MPEKQRVKIKQPLTTIDDVLEADDMRALIGGINAKVPDTLALVVIRLAREGIVTIEHAGIIGDIGAVGLMEKAKILLLNE